MTWRLGADLGSNSLGWCAVELDEAGGPFRVVALGSRIFSDGRDPKSKQSLAVDRREARGMRRGRDRFKQRQAALLKQLVATGLFPPETEAEARAALENLDPFELRARALHAPLAPHEIGRSLFHLNQRRGFKSNRKTDRKADDESGKIRLGVKRLQDAMTEEGAATFGEFLHNRRAAATDPNHVPSVRTRLRPEAGEGAKGDGYDFYPDRQIIEEEFERIWEAQGEFHPTLLTRAAHHAVHKAIFDQRKLKPPNIGKCTLVPGDERLPKAHPLFQRRRLLEEVNALRVVRAGENPQPLTLEQRNALVLKLKYKKADSFETLRSKVLKLDAGARFNKESENRKELRGDEVAAVMADKKRVGSRWGDLAPERQWEIVHRIREAESDAEARAAQDWLEAEHHLTPQQAKAAVDAHLPKASAASARPPPAP